MARPPALLLPLVLLLLAAPSAAQAQATASQDVREAVQGVQDDGVYVDPERTDVGRSGESEIEGAVRSASSPFYVAVLPAQGASGGTPGNVLRAFVNANGQRRGTYVLTMPRGNGNTIRAISSERGAQGTVAGEIAGQVAQTNCGDGV